MIEDDIDDDYDDTRGLDDGQDYADEAPLFGCACENPIEVDTVCTGCIAYLAEEMGHCTCGQSPFGHLEGCPGIPRPEMRDPDAAGVTPS